MAHLKQKHYEAIARVIRNLREDGTFTRENVARSLAEYFARENPSKFNRKRFMELAGVEDSDMLYFGGKK